MAAMKHARQPLAKTEWKRSSLLRSIGWCVSWAFCSPRARRGGGVCCTAWWLRAEHAVECILYLDAHRLFFEALGCTGPRPRPTLRPHSLVSGFRRTRGSRRLFFKSARIRLRKASLIARVTHLIEALIYRALYVMHFMVRMARGLCFSHIVPCAPPAVALAADVPRALCFADSS